jgi:type IV pilus assembly protein PilV
MKNYINKQAGVSLIEVLVAVFVVSVGLLGVARMELFAKNSNFEAVQRTTAVMIANEMMQKIRANPSQLAGYAGQTVGSGGLSFPGNNCTDGSTDCTPAQVVTWDLYEWEQQLIGSAEKAGTANTGGLVSPRGCITTTAAGGVAGEYTVAVAWRGNSPMTNPTSTTCGNGASLYGTDEEYRRVTTITFFVSDDGVN